MGQIDAALNTILTNLQNTNGVTQAQYQAVYQAINDSPALVALPTDSMLIEYRQIHLTPGMTVTAEIKTGRRRIISYLLSPLIQHARESLHER